MQNNNTENKNTPIEIKKEESDMEFIKTQNEITVIDIPEQVKKADEAEKAKKAEEERIRKHVIIYQFSEKKVYTTAIKAYLLYILCRICYGTIYKLIFGELELIDSTNQETLKDEFKNPGSTFILILNIISTCIKAPFIEELIFRSFLFKLINWAGKKVQEKVNIIGIIIRILAFVISSFAFAFAHYGFSFELLTNEIKTFPSYFIAGLCLAYAYNCDGYLLASVFTHMLNNIVATISMLM